MFVHTYTDNLGTYLWRIRISAGDRFQFFQKTSKIAHRICLFENKYMQIITGKLK